MQSNPVMSARIEALRRGRGLVGQDSSDIEALLAAGAREPHNRDNDDLDEDDGVHISTLPRLAIRLLGPVSEIPEVFPHRAAAMTWKLQRLASISLVLLFMGFFILYAAFYRGVEAWKAGSGLTSCHALRVWLALHLCILALGLIGCCSGVAFVLLAGWILIGMFLLSGDRIATCPGSMIESTQEAVVFEIVLFVLVLVVGGLSFCCCKEAERCLLACHGLDVPWEPETHLVLVENTSDMVEMVEMEQAHEDQEALEATTTAESDLGLSENDCVICYVPLTGLGEVIGTAVCGHRFHKECILEWLTNNRTCPLCRHRVDKPMTSGRRPGAGIDIEASIVEIPAE